MSDEARAWAKRVKGLRIPTKAVLNALADYADADGWAWPKISTLAEVTGMSEAYVRRQLVILEGRDPANPMQPPDPERALLEKIPRFHQNGGQTSNLFRLKMPRDQLAGSPVVVVGGAHTFVSPPPIQSPAPPDSPHGSHDQGVSAPPIHTVAALRTSVDLEDSYESSGDTGERRSPLGEANSAGFTGELIRVPPEIRSKIRAHPQCGEGFCGSYIDPAWLNVTTGELHPRSGLAKSEIEKRLGRRGLRQLGLTLGEPRGASGMKGQ